MRNKKGFTLFELLFVFFAMAATFLIASFFFPELQYLVEYKRHLIPFILAGVGIVYFLILKIVGSLRRRR